MITAHTVKQTIKSLPLIKQGVQHMYEKRFATATRCNLFYGVYPSFTDASMALPETKSHGYDNNAAAEMYDTRAQKVHSTDYPVLFWLSHILSPDIRVFDIGGHFGISFYAYQKLLTYPEGLHWRIFDVPAVVERGKNIAADKGESRLSFVTDYQFSGHIDVILANGSLQYIEPMLSSLINPADIKPNHIILNMLPVTNLDTYYTVQNIGTAFCPYKIVNEQELIRDLSGLGYSMIDRWENPEKHCEIPFSDPKYSLDHYMGYYFRKDH